MWIRLQKDGMTYDRRGGYWLGARAAIYAEELAAAVAVMPDLGEEWELTILTDVSNKSTSQYVLARLDNGERENEWKIRISDHELPVIYRYADRDATVYEVTNGEIFTPAELASRICTAMATFARG